MSPRTWPAGRPGDEEAKTAATPTPTVDFATMTTEQVHARAQELEDGFRAARREQEAVAVEVATRRGKLVEAAGHGYEAAVAAQASINEAEQRLRTAELVVEAVSLAHRPFAEESHRLRRERRREDLAGEFGTAVAARDRIDADLLVAIENLSAVAARRQAATAAAHAIEKRAAAEGLAVGSVERFLLPAPIREAIKRIPLLGS